MPPTTDRATTLRLLQAEIRTCTRCVEMGYIPQAAPILHGNHVAPIMVVGQAPGIAAAERPVPFSGGSGKTLRGWLARAGFPEDALHDPDQFYLTSLTKCFPGRAKQGDGDRAPSRTEVALCASHLNRELELVQPDLVLALGRLAIDAFLPSLRKSSLSALVGTIHPAEHPAIPHAQVLPLPHPSGVSRWHNLPANRERVAQAMAILAGLRR